MGSLLGHATVHWDQSVLLILLLVILLLLLLVIVLLLSALRLRVGVRGLKLRLRVRVRNLLPETGARFMGSMFMGSAICALFPE